MLPLVERVASELSNWLAPAFRDPVALRVDIDTLPALASEREALWASLEKTSFLTDAEKRTLAGFSSMPGADAKRFNPGQPRVPSGNPNGGQWTDGGGGGGDGAFGRTPDGTPVDPAQGRRGGFRRPPASPDPKPGPNPPISPGQRLRNQDLASKKHPDTGIPFDKDGFPDFSSVATKTVTVPHTGTSADRDAANKAAGYPSTPKGMVWHHHQDGRTMQLVPQDLHRQTGHTGSKGLGNLPGRK